MQMPEVAPEAEARGPGVLITVITVIIPHAKTGVLILDMEVVQVIPAETIVPEQVV